SAVQLENWVGIRIVSQCFHTLPCQACNQPLVEWRDHGLPAHGRARIESFLLFTCQTGWLMLVDTLFGVKQVLGKVHLYECAKFRQGFPRFRQQILVAKQLIIVEVLKPTMDACSLPVLPDYEQRAQL